MNLPFSDPHLLALLELEELTSEQTEELVAALNASKEQQQNFDAYLSELRKLSHPEDIEMPSEVQWDSVLGHVLKQAADNSVAEISEASKPDNAEAGSKDVETDSGPAKPDSDALAEMDRGSGVSIFAMVVLAILFFVSFPAIKNTKPANKQDQAQQQVKGKPQIDSSDLGEDPLQPRPEDLTSADTDDEVIIDLQAGNDFTCCPKSTIDGENHVKVIWVTELEDDQ